MKQIVPVAMLAVLGVLVVAPTTTAGGRSPCEYHPTSGRLVVDLREYTVDLASSAMAC